MNMQAAGQAAGRRAFFPAARLDPYTTEILRRVLEKMEEGCKEHIPLTHLTNEACTPSAVNQKAKHSVELEKGTLTIKSGMLCDDSEELLDPYTFQSAYGRLFRAMEWYPELAERAELVSMWQEHYNHMLQQGDFAALPGLYITYDV